jgi:hypothetical protein
MKLGAQRMMNRKPKRSQESGYAFLMALFAILIMIAASTVVLQNMRTQAQREKEEEMVWRGNQYERAIRLYFHKTGKYPQDIDALQKGLPDLHFLRQAYKDPMNGDDGSWRFIYVNQTGAIIGSVKYANLQQMALLDTPGGVPPMPGGGLGVPASSLAASSNSSSTQTDPNAPPQPPQNPAQNPAQGFGQNPQNPGQGGTGQNPQPGGPGGGFSLGSGQQPGSQSPQSGSPGSMFSSSGGSTGNPLLDMKPTGPVDGPVLGGFLTGVGSKVDRKSVKLYKGAKKYKDWEFIWNPLEDQANAAQQQLGQATQAGALGQALGSIFGAPNTGAPGAGGNPFGNPNPPGGTNPQQPTPQPQPQQPQPQQP